jgi:hypothetical protein
VVKYAIAISHGEVLMATLEEMIAASLKQIEAEKPSASTAAAPTPKQKTAPPAKQVTDERKLKPVMSLADILTVIGQIRPGSKVQIQFKKEEIADVMYLQGMHQGGILSVNEMEVMVMMAVVMSQRWEHDINRIFHLTANTKWNVDWFKDRLARRLEAITIVS